MAATSQARPILRSLSSRSIGLLVCVIGIWAIFAAAVAATRTPWSNEAWAANPAVTLVDNGHLGTTILESKDTWLQGIDQHMYWMMPLHSLAQAAWYRVVGFGLIRQRLLSVAFGALALTSWFVIILNLTGQRFIALLAVGVVGFQGTFLAAAGNGRMDMMAVSLGTAAIASYLLLRGSRPRIAILISHSLAAASIWTHPCGLLLAALLVVLILYLDRRRLRLGDLGLALVPYVLAASLWSLYIAQAPADFMSQFGGNVSGFAGEYTYQHRFAGLCAPLEALHREWSLRYYPAFGFASLGSKGGWFQATWLVAVVLAVLTAIFHPVLRKQRPIQMLLAAAGIVLVLMTVFEGMKFQNYLVYSVPFLAAVLAATAGPLLQTHGPRSVLLGAFLLLLAVPQMATSLWQIKANPLQNEFRPVADYLSRNSGPGDRIIAGAEFGYVFGFNGRMRDDVRLGYHSGLRPALIVTNGWYRDWFARSAEGDPALHSYLQLRLRDDYEIVFRSGDFTVYRSRRK